MMQFLAQYQSNIEIARKLMISEKTVRNHVSNIFSKLHVADRTAAILRARSAGLGKVLPQLRFFLSCDFAFCSTLAIMPLLK
jgi:hypothetical protein